MGDLELNPIVGNVVFGSGREKWAFSLDFFSENLAKKFGLNKQKLQKKLWGEHYYDPKSKAWRTQNTDEEGNLLERGFLKFVLNPIFEVIKVCKSGDKSAVAKMMQSL